MALVSCHAVPCSVLSSVNSVLQLHERSCWKAAVPDMHQSFSDTVLCAYTASLYIHRFWYAAMHYNKTHVPYHYILHTKRRLHMVISSTWMWPFNACVSSSNTSIKAPWSLVLTFFAPPNANNCHLATLLVPTLITSNHEFWTTWGWWIFEHTVQPEI